MPPNWGQSRITRSIVRAYQSAGLIFLNLILLFVAANLLTGIMYYIVDWVRLPPEGPKQFQGPETNAFFSQDGAPIDTGRRTGYQLDWFDYQAYEGIAPEYAADVLDGFYELSKLGFMYQPWVLFSEPPFSSKVLNIDVNTRGFPIRRTVNPPNSIPLPILNIFVFGGSTTFGYNVSDEHTWPSYLSSTLNERGRSKAMNVHVEVTNFGRGYFYPTQELLLAIDLLKSGYQPNIMIFSTVLTLEELRMCPGFRENLVSRLWTDNSLRKYLS